MRLPHSLALAALIVAIASTAALVSEARQDGRKLGYTDTPMLPGNRWRVHDGTRPQPRIVSPGEVGTAPSDATVLFDGKNLDMWRDDKGGPARWTVENGCMVIPRNGGTLVSRDAFGDCQLHVEFASPDPPRGSDQGRGNSGVLLMGRYEVQVLDSYENQTYPDGQAAAIYGQYPPLVNASRKPGEWQTLDIMFTTARFAEGKLTTPAHMTILHNGVLVHNHTALIGAVAFRAVGTYAPHEAKLPLCLQDHGDPVRYRNIWIREVRDYDE